MARFEIFHNPRCSKSRQALQRLTEAGVTPVVIEYLNDPPDRARLQEILGLLRLEDPRKLMRTQEAVYRELGLATASGDALLDAMVAHPVLIERPIVIKDGKAAVIGRPPENIDALL
jgi:arsenate reductase